MDNNIIDVLLNDNYKVLDVLWKNQTAAVGKTFVPLMQSDIVEVTGFGRSKVIKIFQDLSDAGYIVKESRGRYRITNKGNEVLVGIDKLQKRIASL